MNKSWQKYKPYAKSEQKADKFGTNSQQKIERITQKTEDLTTTEASIKGHRNPSGGQPFVLCPDLYDEWSPPERREVFRRQGTN